MPCVSFSTLKFINKPSLSFKTFYGCSALNELVVDPGNVTYKSVAGSLFSADGKTLIWAKGSTAVLVPEGVETIYDTEEQLFVKEIN